MIALARLSLRRPVLALLAWSAMAVALGAIGFGIEHYTATAVTGTAATMVAATVPFLFTDLLSMRQFGVAVATAVLLDALVVRPVVLPAAIELLGRLAWWPTRPPVPTATDSSAEPPSRPAAPSRVKPIPVQP